MLFGIYFPTRSLRDQRWPWIKWVLLILFAGVGLGYWTIFLVWHEKGTKSACQLRSAYEVFRNC
jgi:hypothetical protein